MTGVQSCALPILKLFRNNWGCDSRTQCIKGYTWQFNAGFPGKAATVSGITFRDRYDFLGQLSKGLLQSIANNDPSIYRGHCLAKLKWGGVFRGNTGKITELGDGIIHYFNYVKNTLDLDSFNRLKPAAA